MLIFRIWWSLQFYTIFVPFWRIKENIGTKYRADSPLEFLQVCWEILLWEYPLFENKRVFEMLITSNSIERSVVKTIDFVWRSNQKYLNLFGPLVYRLIGLLLFKLYCLVIWLAWKGTSAGTSYHTQSHKSADMMSINFEYQSSALGFKSKCSNHQNKYLFHRPGNN